MKKRNLFLILVLVLSMCMTACGGNDEEDIDNDEEVIEEVEETEDDEKNVVKIGDADIGFSEEHEMKKNEILAQHDEIKANMESVREQIENGNIGLSINGVGNEPAEKEVIKVEPGAELSVENAGVTVDEYYIVETSYGTQVHFTFTYTNKSDEDRHFNNHRLIAYQDGVRLTEAGSKEVHTMIQPGVSLQVEKAFELRNTTSDVQFKFSSPEKTSTATSKRLESETMVSIK